MAGADRVAKLFPALGQPKAEHVKGLVRAGNAGVMVFPALRQLQSPALERAPGQPLSPSALAMVAAADQADLPASPSISLTGSLFPPGWKVRLCGSFVAL